MTAEIQVIVDGMLQRDPELAQGMLEHLTEICEEYTILQQEAPQAAALFVKIERQ